MKVSGLSVKRESTSWEPWTRTSFVSGRSNTERSGIKVETSLVFYSTYSDDSFDLYNFILIISLILVYALWNYVLEYLRLLFL